MSDIRIYKSDIPNVNGNQLPADINNKALSVVLHRVVMKLRENKFSLGEFDHLYLNFTVCVENGVISPAKRDKDIYHPWYRYYDVGVDDGLYNTLDSEQCIERVISLTEKTLLKHFAFDEDVRNVILSSVAAAKEQKENMLMQYKVKETASRKAVVFLRYLDSGLYFPLLCVYDADGNQLLKKDLPVCADLNAFGTIQLSNKSVTIKPRQNAFTSALIPQSFVLN